MGEAKRRGSLDERISQSKQHQFDTWLKGRPQVIKDLAHQFPPWTQISIEGQILYVVAYNEDGSLGVSPVNPATDYDKAIACRLPIDPTSLNRTAP